MAHRGHDDPVHHLNNDHTDDLLAAARAFAGYPDATAARAQRVDRFGIDLLLDGPGGRTEARIEFADPVPEDEFPRGVRVAFVRLSRRARQ